MKRFKLRNLDVDRVDLVDKGANQHADIVIHKGVDVRASIAKNMKQGYPADTQLKNGPPPVASNTLDPMPKDEDEDEKKKKKKGAKGSAFPERNAAESSTSAGSPPAPVEKHSPGGTGHDQKNHGKKGSGGGRKSSVSGDAKPGSKGGVTRAEKNSIKGKYFRDAGLADGGEDKSLTGHGKAPGDMSERTLPKYDRATAELKATKIPDSYKPPGKSQNDKRFVVDMMEGGKRVDSHYFPNERAANKFADEKNKSSSTGFHASTPKSNYGAGYGMTREDFERAQARDKRSGEDDVGGIPVKKHTPGGKGHDQQNHAGGRGGSGGASGPASDKGEGQKRRSLSAIAREVRSDWGSKVNFGAKPYLDAMGGMDSIHDKFYYDDGKSVVAYFLSNSGTWRGETARKVKAELKEMLKDKPGSGSGAGSMPKEFFDVIEGGKKGPKIKDKGKGKSFEEKNPITTAAGPFKKAFPPKKGLPPQGPPQAGPPQAGPPQAGPPKGPPPPQAPPPQAGKGLPKLDDVVGKPSADGKPAPGKAAGVPTAPGQADPSQTPTPGSPATPGAPGGEPLAPPELSPGAPGPPLGPGSAPGKFPKETPKVAAVPPGKVGGPAAKPEVPAPDDEKKKKLADQLKQRGKPPSGQPFA